jgi:hypothetical protein
LMELSHTFKSTRPLLLARAATVACQSTRENLTVNFAMIQLDWASVTLEALDKGTRQRHLRGVPGSSRISAVFFLVVKLNGLFLRVMASPPGFYGFDSLFTGILYNEWNENRISRARLDERRQWRAAKRRNIYIRVQ